MRRKAFDGWAVGQWGGWVFPIAFLFLTAEPPNRLDGQELPLNAGALFLVDYGDLDRTDINGNTIARIAPRNFEFLASYATNLTGSFVLGINYKLVQFRVD